MSTSYTQETEGGNRTHNHTEPVSLCPEDAISEALLHAVDYDERGWAPVPLLPGQTNPSHHGGETELAATDLAKTFHPDYDANVGLALGEPSGGLVGVRVPTAQIADAVEVLLNPTGLKSGRERALSTTLFYQVQPVPESAAQTYSNSVPLWNLVSTGEVEEVEPSWDRAGVPVRWSRFGAPAPVNGERLKRGLNELTATAIWVDLLPRNYLGRNKSAKALIGGLLRAGYDKDRVARFFSAVAVLGGDTGGLDVAATI